MTRTTMSLIYCDSDIEKGIGRLSNVNGPFCFSGVQALRSHLLNYVQNRIAEAYFELFLGDFSEQLNLTETEVHWMGTKEVFWLLQNNQDFFDFDCLISWYQRVTSGGFEYKITEQPTASFLESFCSADAIEVDGYFVRNIEKPSLADAIASPHTPVFDFSDIEGFDCRGDSELTLEQALAATYDVQNNVWVIGNLWIQCFSVKTLP